MSIQHVFTGPDLDAPVEVCLPSIIEIGRPVQIEGLPMMRVESSSLRIYSEPWAEGWITRVDVVVHAIGDPS